MSECGILAGMLLVCAVGGVFGGPAVWPLAVFGVVLVFMMAWINPGPPGGCSD